MLYGKITYREACDLKIGWDKELPNQLAKKWYNSIKRLDARIKVSRCIGLFKEPINTIELHSFVDASKDGVSAVFYTAVHQTCRTNQGLLGAKRRLSKKKLTIPRLELEAAHVASKLMENAI